MRDKIVDFLKWYSCSEFLDSEIGGRFASYKDPHTHYSAEEIVNRFLLSRKQNVKESERLPSKTLETIRMFQGLYPDAMLTGTAALVLYGFDLKRMPSDIDFVLPSIDPDQVPGAWLPLKMPGTFKAKCYYTTLNGMRVEVIVWPEYTPSEVDGVRVTGVFDIIEAKLDLGLTGTKKHIRDFHLMLVQLLKQSGGGGLPSGKAE